MAEVAGTTVPSDVVLVGSASLLLMPSHPCSTVPDVTSWRATPSTSSAGDQVHSTAKLRSRLYPDPPGSSLSVTFERRGTTVTTSVVLADLDTAAPGDGTSP